METTYSHARQNLASLLDKVVDDCETVIIHRKGRPDVAMIDAAELSSIQETLYVLGSTANGLRLLTTIASIEDGTATPIPWDDVKDEIYAELKRAKSRSA